MLCNYALFIINTKNNYKKAEEIYKRILVTHPNHTVANGTPPPPPLCIIFPLFCIFILFYFYEINTSGNYGLLLKNYLNNPDKAEEKFLKAVECSPENPHWYLVLGKFYKTTKKNPKLSKEYTKKGMDLQKSQAKK